MRCEIYEIMRNQSDQNAQYDNAYASLHEDGSPPQQVPDWSQWLNYLNPMSFFQDESQEPGFLGMSNAQAGFLAALLIASLSAYYLKSSVLRPYLKSSKKSEKGTSAYLMLYIESRNAD